MADAMIEADRSDAADSSAFVVYCPGLGKKISIEVCGTQTRNLEFNSLHCNGKNCPSPERACLWDLRQNEVSSASRVVRDGRCAFHLKRGQDALRTRLTMPLLTNDSAPYFEFTRQIRKKMANEGMTTKEIGEVIGQPEEWVKRLLGWHDGIQAGTLRCMRHGLGSCAECQTPFEFPGASHRPSRLLSEPRVRATESVVVGVAPQPVSAPLVVPRPLEVVLPSKPRTPRQERIRQILMKDDSVTSLEPVVPPVRSTSQAVVVLSSVAAVVPSTRPDPPAAPLGSPAESETLDIPPGNGATNEAKKPASKPPRRQEERQSKPEPRGEHMRISKETQIEQAEWVQRIVNGEGKTIKEAAKKVGIAVKTAKKRLKMQLNKKVTEAKERDKKTETAKPAKDGRRRKRRRQKDESLQDRAAGLALPTPKSERSSKGSVLSIASALTRELGGKLEIAARELERREVDVTRREAAIAGREKELKALIEAIAPVAKWGKKK